jgi:hypothetical protein
VDLGDAGPCALTAPLAVLQGLMKPPLPPLAVGFQEVVHSV